MSQSITRQRFKELLNAADISTLFNELGWDHAQDIFTVHAGKAVHTLRTVANKRGFAVLVHTADEVADKTLRQSIEKKVARIHFEHLLVFRNEKGDQQVWQLAIRRPHQPITYHEATWHKGTDPEHLFQKLSSLFIPLEAEEGITLVDVKEQVTAQFEKNTKEVTKKFYREFSAQHKDFLKFIRGIQEKVDQEWYASLMLNRLMFIYFIQKKGFLNGDRDYLQNKLKESKQKRGGDQFYTFYRDFLLVLFHQGLGSPTRSAELLKEIGKVPYLNGGLFDVHDLEKNHPIEIKDQAFEGLFAFFDTWNWHLDTRASSTGRDVNPDVIGYIFEQYINDRAQMGAYYTKEDITEYISKNTIIPWLFDEARRKDAQAFKPEGGVWKLLRDDPDKYIYPSVRHGIVADDRAPHAGPWWQDPLFSDLPADVRAGLDPEQKDLWKIRKAWNVRAPEAIALPTEIYRELIERRRRYLDVRSKLVAGEVTSINDLITYNLDIRQFAQDVIHEYEGSDLVGAFYDAISRITVLDPTCGSGAFLFAALGILQPLYEQCLDRMQWFVEVDNEKGSGKKHPEFRKVLDRMKQHPNRDYFIYKSIILQNLYGVDIMREAVEIAKLRLFLKLVSTVDPDPRKDNYGIEPLPDIDFNIRSGNTLVGFATKAEVKGISAWSLDFDTTEQDRVEEKCEVVDKAFERYKQIQLNEGEDYQTFRKAKDELHKRLAALREELDVYLAKSYTITDLPKQQKQFDAWKASHTPFHWFAEYYGIVHQRGGFDVIVGNPPYVKYDDEIKRRYRISKYSSLEAANLYAFVMERSNQILSNHGFASMIIPISAFSTPQFKAIQNIYCNDRIWISHYAATTDPGILFEGVKLQLTIYIRHKDTSLRNRQIMTTNYLRWFREEREVLFDCLSYATTHLEDTGYVPKYQNSISESILRKHKLNRNSISVYLKGPGTIFYKKYGNYFWKIFLDFIPEFSIDGVPSQSGSIARLEIKSKDCYVAISALASTSFYLNYMTTSDCRNITSRDFSNYHIPDAVFSQYHGKLDKLGFELMTDTKSKTSVRIESLKNGSVRKNQIFDKYAESKAILDRIDVVLGEAYGYSEEELDYLVNFDLKYRTQLRAEADDLDDAASIEPIPTKEKLPKAAEAKTLRQAKSAKKDDPDPFV